MDTEEGKKAVALPTGLGLSFVLALRPVDFRHIKSDPQQRQHGFLLDDIRGRIAHFRGLKGDPPELDYTELLGPLVRAVQELAEWIEVAEEDLDRRIRLIEEAEKDLSRRPRAPRA